jgi:glycosyltransferase involved in cell wall biosynthesis
LKVTHLSTYQGGGAGTAAFRLHQGLLKENVDSRFLCAFSKSHDRTVFTAGKKSQSRLNRILTRFNLTQSPVEKEKYKVKNAAGDYDYYSIPLSDFRLEEHPLVKDADIINLHWVSDFINYPTFFESLNKPIVWTFHDMNPFFGGFHYRGDAERNSHNAALMTVENTYLEIKKNALLKTERIKVVCPSQWLLNASQTSEVMKSFSHFLIPYGLDTETFKIYSSDLARQLFNIPLDKKIILFVSESIENRRKGFDLVIDAIKSISVKDNFLLVAVGDAGRSYDVPGIAFIGNISDERLMALAYASADAYLIASREDNLPNVMLESLCCGTPVLGFPVGGIKETVVNDVNGFLAPQLSASGLKDLISRFLTNDKFDRQWIRADSKEKYNLRKQALSYIQLYKSF